MRALALAVAVLMGSAAVLIFIIAPDASAALSLPWWGGSGVIADTISAPRCVGGATPWEFEQELGVPDLGGFSPSGFQFFGWLFFAAMGFAAVLALLMIVVGGVQYMVAAGNTSGQGAAKKRISDALLGLVLALASVLILYTINPDLTRIGAPTLDDADIEGGIRGECLDLDFGDIRENDPLVEACYQGSDEGRDRDALSSCMCSSAGYFTLTDDDPTTASCVYACLNAAQIPTADTPSPPRVCETECAGVWEDIVGGGSVDSDDANAPACLQCASQYIINASDGPGGSTWDYCQCSSVDASGNPTGDAIVPSPSQCEVCTGESDCQNLAP